MSTNKPLPLLPQHQHPDSLDNISPSSTHPLDHAAKWPGLDDECRAYVLDVLGEEVGIPKQFNYGESGLVLVREYLSNQFGENALPQSLAIFKHLLEEAPQSFQARGDQWHGWRHEHATSPNKFWTPGFPYYSGLIKPRRETAAQRRYGSDVPFNPDVESSVAHQGVSPQVLSWEDGNENIPPKIWNLSENDSIVVNRQDAWETRANFAAKDATLRGSRPPRDKAIPKTPDRSFSPENFTRVASPVERSVQERPVSRELLFIRRCESVKESEPKKSAKFLRFNAKACRLARMFRTCLNRRKKPAENSSTIELCDMAENSGSDSAIIQLPDVPYRLCNQGMLRREPTRTSRGSWDCLIQSHERERQVGNVEHGQDPLCLEGCQALNPRNIQAPSSEQDDGSLEVGLSQLSCNIDNTSSRYYESDSEYVSCQEALSEHGEIASEFSLPSFTFEDTDEEPALIHADDNANSLLQEDALESTPGDSTEDARRNSSQVVPFVMFEADYQLALAHPSRNLENLNQEITSGSVPEVSMSNAPQETRENPCREATSSYMPDVPTRDDMSSFSYGSICDQYDCTDEDHPEPESSQQNRGSRLSNMSFISPSVVFM